MKGTFNSHASIFQGLHQHALPLETSDLRIKLQVVLSTHAVGGLSAQDLILAARIDALPVTYSPKWYKQQQQQEAAAQR